MSPEVLITFIAACILLALTPGPNMSLILANTLTGGLRAGFVTLSGTTTGLALLVAAAAAGMSSMMVFMSEWFDVIRWVGALYLVYLGARQLWLLRRRVAGLAVKAPAAGANLYLQGVLVSLSNPKVLLFLGAFLPQFVDMSRPAFDQIMVLGLIVMAVATATDCIYAVLAGSARQLLTQARVRVMTRVSGVILMIGGVWLALQRRG
jgi:homoserine/homoserine lactone efflux protein